MSFLEDYEPVEERLRRFWEDHPGGRIRTALVHHDAQQYVILAEVYTDAEGLHPTATGYAEETVSSRGVNATNAVENCETSAIGRALANMNYAPKGSRPSREEMTKAGASQSPADQARAALKAYCKYYALDMTQVATGYEHLYAESLKSAENAGRIFEYTHSVMSGTAPQPASSASEGEQ